MNLNEETKRYIDMAVRRFYHKAIEHGAEVSEVEYVRLNIYKVRIGNMQLTYMGTCDGKAQVVGAEGDIF